MQLVGYLFSPYSSIPFLYFYLPSVTRVTGWFLDAVSIPYFYSL